MEKMNDIERLTLAQALYKSIGELVDTKNPDSLRSQVDRQFRELYDATGSKSFDVKVFDVPVGTYSIRFSKPKDSEARDVFEVDDYIALAHWFNDADADEVKKFVALNLADFARWQFDTTGEVPDGCSLKQVVKPAEDKHYIGGALKVDQESVIAAFGKRLEGSVVGLLEGDYE